MKASVAGLYEAHFGPQNPASIGADRVATHLLQLLDDVGSRCLRTAADCRNSGSL